MRGTKLEIEKLVINLKHREDRRDLFQKNNSKLSNWRFVEAIDGYNTTYLDVLDMGYDIKREWRSKYAVQKMKKGELGCSLSHLLCWKIVLETNKPMIIMEDDAVINWELWDEVYYQEVIKRDDCEFLYLQHNDANLNTEFFPEQPDDEKLVSPNYPYNMTAYMLTPKGAELLIKDFEKELIVVDEYLPLKHAAGEIPLWALKTDSCNQISRDENQSSIEVNDYVEDVFHDYQNVHWCTIGTDTEKCEHLFNSAKKQNIPLKNLGEGVDWQDTMEGFGGGPKIKIMYDFVNSDEVDDMDIVFFTDGYDTFFVDDGQTILDRYFEMNYDMVWAGESHLWPCDQDELLIENFKHKYNEWRMTEKDAGPDKPVTPYFYLNSGGYIGRAWIIKKLFSEYENAEEFCQAVDTNTFVDDQEFCQRLHTRERVFWFNQVIDYDAYIFQTHDENISKLDNGQMWNPSTNTCGCVYHGNNINSNWKTYDRVYRDHVDYSYTRGMPNLFRVTQYGKFYNLDKDMIIVDFMDAHQCEALINMAESHGGFQPFEGDKFPAQEIRLKELGLWDMMCKTWEEQIYPIVEKYWHPLEMYGMRDAFVMKYSMDTQRSLNLHNDASMVTGSVKLNDGFEGGDLIFPRQGITNKDILPGKMILFPGQVTHGHECTELISGVKYSLTMWSSRYPGDIN